jgi:integrase
MGSITKRGTRTAPKFYLSFRAGVRADGSPAYVMRAAKGITSMADARTELARIELAIARGESWEVESEVIEDMAAVLDRWSAGITNRAAYEDRLIVRRDLVPRWRGWKVADVKAKDVIQWLDELAKTTMAPQTQRHRYTLLSRFFSWCIESELADANPCLMVPKGRRPAARRVKEPMVLEDDAMVPKLMAAMPDDLGLMFYLSRFAGLRPGEVAALRMSDMEWVGEGTIRTRHSFNGELKESKNGSKPVKWVPAPVDAADVLGLHLKRRKLQGAGPEDLVFLYTRPGILGRKRTDPKWAGWGGWHRKEMQDQWRAACDKLGLPKDLKFYTGRHSYVTKALVADNPLDQVSAAIGHADPSTTKKYYAHYIRKDFAAGLRQGLTSAAANDGSGAGGRRGRTG